jgi:hypothetical protein
MLEIQSSDIKVNKQPMPSHRFRAKKKREASKLRSHTLDLKKIRAWSQVGCTRDEIAALLNVDQGWLDDAITKDGDLEEAILCGFVDFKHSLRSTQARLALSGHPGMLIWLGKQFLGQSDKQESKQETTVNVVLQNAMKELRDMSAEDLSEIKKIIERPLLDVTPEDVTT